MFSQKRNMSKRQDRLMAFFDAILAIAMTVLALEIAVPQLSAISWGQRYDFFVKLTCYLISFMAMGTLWYIHNNFFSNHDIIGNGEIILHLVLLFVITLFQPLTRAIGEHPADAGIRAFYLADFLVMYGLLALIFIIIGKKEKQLNEQREARRHIFSKKSEVSAPVTSHPLSDEAKELQHLLKIAMAIENPDGIREKLAEYMPDEYQSELEVFRKRREENYRLSLYSVFAMALAIFAAVITLMFSAWYAYIALAAGFVAIFLIRHKGRKVSDETV